MKTKVLAQDNLYWMKKALRLAAKGQYTTRPNPCVGCVIVKDGQEVGSGWHQCAGEPHAEVYALQEVGELAQGATCYVTLEPCAHHGRTPPCCQVLVKAGIQHVVIANEDPNPFVNGKGVEYLKANGVEVLSGILAEEGKKLNRAFFKRMREGKSWVTLKLGTTLDGKIADFKGDSQWITGHLARQDVQKLRARHDAVLSTARTVMKDEARLTVRTLPDDLPESLKSRFKQPLRVILDRKALLPKEAAIFKEEHPVLVYTAKSLSKDNQLVDYQWVPTLSDQTLDLPAIFNDLAQREINSVLVEAGGVLGGALLNQGLVDEIVIYMAPSLLGQQAQSGIVFPEALSLSQRYQLQFDEVQTLGSDIKIAAYYKEVL
ncbi:MAG: riboflavin biosynthesis protein RibD [Gammaproteobacteria bacterium RIFCSPHIGHO2_12_FULL_35_23]|nr:MAG: riboflavin biosynthesis protein RibD [Gammaproteobacteria bacterium RIFCSPHIGHO2_12_FULL_35_23]